MRRGKLMTKTDWIFILAIVSLVCVTALSITDHIPVDDTKELIIFIITTIISVVGSYVIGKHRGILAAKGEDGE
jgi:hypothetical protein